jgi:putative hydrolase of the HAD superfamily
MMIKNVFFDAASTLFHLRGSVGEHYAAIARELGSGISPRALDDAFARAWKNAPLRSAADQPREDDDKAWWRQLVSNVLDQIANLAPEFDRARFFELAYPHFAEPGVWVLYPEVHDVLEMLVPEFELAIISNFDCRLHTILRHLKIGAFFQHVFISSEIGADKPDREIYRRALTQSGARAAEAIHVGDDPERDWHAAAQAGLHVFELDRRRNSLRDLPEYLARLSKRERPA